MQISNGSFPEAPTAYSSCYAVDLSGYVYIANYTDLQFLTPEPVPSYYNTYRSGLLLDGLAPKRVEWLYTQAALLNAVCCSRRDSPSPSAERSSVGGIKLAACLG